MHDPTAFEEHQQRVSEQDRLTILRVLRQLLTGCREAEAKLTAAARRVGEAALEEILADYGGQLHDFAARLELELVRLGEPSPIDRAPAQALPAAGKAVVLGECERAEAAIAKSYHDVLSHTLPPGYRPLLHFQFEMIKAAHAHLRQLRDDCH